MSNLGVEGYTAAEPVLDEDWEDEVRWQVNYQWQLRGDHNRDGYVCDEAGGAACLALGHAPDPETGWEDDDDHPYGWGYEPICPPTKSGTACTECESQDCDWQPFDSSELWKAVAA